MRNADTDHRPRPTDGSRQAQAGRPILESSGLRRALADGVADSRRARARARARRIALDDIGRSGGRSGGKRAARGRRPLRSRSLLDRLAELRLDLLNGGVPAARLHALAHALRSSRRLSGDPRIDVVLEEIELRVEVEVAKLANSYQPSGPSVAEASGDGGF